ncbi:MAG: hypothetical protein DBW85_09925 [Synechococcus sp. MED-G71]|jgi:hypothetical protein|nr:MAG: hypothetical protein DBW85_09925 [Synechococcus sp. MED-G71]|tara:strand:+ start:19323 stop:19523 length:201 start_codon:yes stop_codon:yes gene_type:complete
MDADPILSFHLDLNALRLLHRVVSDAYTNWPGGPPEEQVSLDRMRMQLYAGLMDVTLSLESEARDG